jgi:hypothetical protein
MPRFSEDYDLGISWNPVALTLAWHNGVVYYGDKAFYRFPYTPGEQMSRELLHRVAYCFEENTQVSDEFGPTPYGDIFDVLRLDTPKGPVDPELLRVYPVVFLAGEQRFTPDVVKVLTDYVRGGGTLILNTAMLKGGEFSTDFLGAAIAPSVLKGTTTVRSSDGVKLSSGQFRYKALKPNPGSRVLYTVSGKPVVTRTKYGQGAVVLCSQEFLLEARDFMVDNVRRRKILPTAHDLMKRISEEVSPVHFNGKNLPSQLMYQINRKKNGYVIALYNNGGLVWENRGNKGLKKEVADPC